MIRPLQGTFLAALSFAATLSKVSAAEGPPSFQSPGDKPTLQILSIDKDTFEPEDLVTHENWSAGWSFVRPFEYGDKRFAFLIKSTSGDAQVRERRSQ